MSKFASRALAVLLLLMSCCAAAVDSVTVDSLSAMSSPPARPPIVVGARFDSIGLGGQIMYSVRPDVVVAGYFAFGTEKDLRNNASDPIDESEVGVQARWMWSSHAPKLEQPDWVLFDLDPGKGTWADLITVATAMRKKLESLGLESFPKTSGKRGLHVLVPLRAGYTHERAAQFASEVANAVAAKLQDIATTERSISKRQGRLYIDAGQNGRGKTVVVPYSLRPVEGAPFSAPLKWSEVTKRLTPGRFNLRTLRKRLDAVGDLFAPVLETKQKLP